MKDLLAGRETEARTDIACLNAGLIFYISGKQASIQAGYTRARELVGTRRPLNKLEEWVEAQS
jgi:anthranilate phosphoribosyltransferase